MDFIVWIWLGLLVLFIVFELITTSLTTIWFAGGIAGVGTDCRIFCCVNCAAYFYETVSYEISQSGRREDQCGQSYRTDCKSHCRYQ